MKTLRSSISLVCLQKIIHKKRLSWRRKIKRYENQVAAITGGADGLGKVIAQAFYWVRCESENIKIT